MANMAIGGRRVPALRFRKELLRLVESGSLKQEPLVRILTALIFDNEAAKLKTLIELYGKAGKSVTPNGQRQPDPVGDALLLEATFMLVKKSGHEIVPDIVLEDAGYDVDITSLISDGTTKTLGSVREVIFILPEGDTETLEGETSQVNVGQHVEFDTFHSWTVVITNYTSEVSTSSVSGQGASSTQKSAGSAAQQLTRTEIEISGGTREKQVELILKVSTLLKEHKIFDEEFVGRLLSTFGKMYKLYGLQKCTLTAFRNRWQAAFQGYDSANLVYSASHTWPTRRLPTLHHLAQRVPQSASSSSPNRLPNSHKIFAGTCSRQWITRRGADSSNSH